jgi:hypothetical protein
LVIDHLWLVLDHPLLAIDPTLTPKPGVYIPNPVQIKVSVLHAVNHGTQATDDNSRVHTQVVIPIPCMVVWIPWITLHQPLDGAECFEALTN